jgi:hypothetical protein
LQDLKIYFQFGISNTSDQKKVSIYLSIFNGSQCKSFEYKIFSTFSTSEPNIDLYPFQMSQIDFLDFSSPSPTGSSSSVGMVPFGFHSKTNYDANESLIQIRSDNFAKNIPVKEENIWKRPPPDFRPQVFAPKPPKRNTQDSQMPWLYGTIPGQREIIKRDRPKVIPHLLQSKTKEDKGLVTYFHIDRPFTAKKKFVREGMNEPGEYNNPSPHDFRGV